MIGTSGRRTLLRAGVGAGLAAAAVVLPGQAQETKKKRSDDVVSPTEILMGEHAVLGDLDVFTPKGRGYPL